LKKLADNMAQNEQTLHGEVKSLAKQIDHVKAVVAWQQGYARNSGFYETLNPVELMEDAFQINQSAYERHGIAVVREYDTLPPIVADRHKILQILINLLGNAKQSVAASSAASRRVSLRISRGDGELMHFEVADTGVGIPPENLDRIFSLGFTTKPNGHGFGLHSGANSAKEMGGRLCATSAGAGQGATFILEVPVAPKAGRQAPVEMATV
jgi:signal transduction histidine kinase